VKSEGRSSHKMLVPFFQFHIPEGIILTDTKLFGVNI